MSDIGFKILKKSLSNEELAWRKLDGTIIASTRKELVRELEAAHRQGDVMLIEFAGNVAREATYSFIRDTEIVYCKKLILVYSKTRVPTCFSSSLYKEWLKFKEAEQWKEEFKHHVGSSTMYGGR